jgi:SAM-dependent methyltransferase
MKEQKRLSQRRLNIWRQDYLAYKYLWPNIEWAIQKSLAEVNSEKPFVVDIGCGRKPYRELFGDCIYKGIDYTTEDSLPDIIADATAIPIDAQTVDIVFSSQVIEHVPNPQAMVNECFRLLKPGGVLILTGPFYWPLHEEPYDFHRFTKYGFENLLKIAQFSSWDIKPDGGDWAQIILSINLKMSHFILIPIRILLNLIGITLDTFNKSYKNPANYTVFAKR